jgi:hypothetical protein
MHRFGQLRVRSLRVLLLPFDALDRSVDWIVRRPLEVVAGGYLLLVFACGLTLIGLYLPRRDSLTGWFLGILLIAASLGGIYLLTPRGATRFGHEVVQTWFRGMAGIAAAIALAYLSASASVADAGQANADMTMVSFAAVLAFLSGLVSLRKPK